MLNPPGGPKRRRPLAGALRPVNSSGLKAGRITISCRAFLAVYKRKGVILVKECIITRTKEKESKRFKVLFNLVWQPSRIHQ